MAKTNQYACAQLNTLWSSRNSIDINRRVPSSEAVKPNHPSEHVGSLTVGMSNSRKSHVIACASASWVFRHFLRFVKHLQTYVEFQGFRRHGLCSPALRLTTIPLRKTPLTRCFFPIQRSRNQLFPPAASFFLVQRRGPFRVTLFGVSRVLTNDQGKKSQVECPAPLLPTIRLSFNWKSFSLYVALTEESDEAGNQRFSRRFSQLK